MCQIGNNVEKESLESKVDRLLVVQAEQGEKIDALYKCVYVGNGDPSLKVEVDRIKQKMKLIFWIGAVLFVASAGALAANIF